MSIEKDPQGNPAAAQQPDKQQAQQTRPLDQENELDQTASQAKQSGQLQDQAKEEHSFQEPLAADKDQSAGTMNASDAGSGPINESNTSNEQVESLNQLGESGEQQNQADDKSQDSTESSDKDKLQPDDTSTNKKSKTKRKKKTDKSTEPQKPVRIIHLVFDQQGGEQIKQSFELEAANTGEILYIEDNYSLGPVADLQQAHGWQARKEWWQSVLELPEDTQPEVMRTDKMKLHQLLQQLEQEEDTVLWIWMGQNERDVAGYYYLISYLMAFQGRIHVLYLNNLPFIDEKGHIFYPKQLAEIQPKEFVKAARLARVVTLSEFELDPEEWEKLSKTPGAVRLLEGGKKLIVKENDHYDKIILDQLGSATMKLAKLLGLLATKAKLGVPEYYILWRIKSLIESEQIISQGDFEKGPKNVRLKATQGQLFVELNPEEGEVGDDK